MKEDEYKKYRTGDIILYKEVLYVVTNWGTEKEYSLLTLAPSLKGKLVSIEELNTFGRKIVMHNDSNYIYFEIEKNKKTKIIEELEIGDEVVEIGFDKVHRNVYPDAKELTEKINEIIRFINDEYEIYTPREWTLDEIKNKED